MFIADPAGFLRAFENTERYAVSRERRRVAFKRRAQEGKRLRFIAAYAYRNNRIVNQYLTARNREA